MDNPASSSEALGSVQTDAAQWLAEHPDLATGVGAALLLLVEPLNCWAAVKTLSNGRYAYASAGLQQLFDRGSLAGHSDQELMRPDEALGLRRVEQTVLAQQHMVFSEHRLEIGGKRREFTVTRAPLGQDHIVSVWQERTEERKRENHLQRALVQIEQQHKALEQMRRELQHGTGRDDISGLYLSAQFEDQLLREIDLSTREHREFALVIIAVDPSITATGQPQEVEQRLLEGVGRILRTNTRAMDAACRIADQRFAVLLSGVGLATAHSRMEQLRRQCAAQIVVLDGQDLGLSISMGVSSFPHTASKREELMAASEAAVHEAQRRGGNQVVLAPIPFSE